MLVLLRQLYLMCGRLPSTLHCTIAARNEGSRGIFQNVGDPGSWGNNALQLLVSILDRVALNAPMVATTIVVSSTQGPQPLHLITTCQPPSPPSAIRLNNNTTWQPQQSTTGILQ